MKIAVLGAGAMGMLIGGSLSAANEVLLVDVNQALVEHINTQGVEIREKDGSLRQVYPKAAVDTQGYAPVELVIVFVKAMYSQAALDAHRALIGKDTFLMTLQNGSGHEETLLRYADREHVVIGTTQHNSSVTGLGQVYHGGTGRTYLGGLEPDVSRLLPIEEAFCASGLEAAVEPNVKKLIWRKMFTNVSSSVLTGVLQVPMGFIVSDAHAWELCTRLVKEAVAVANGDGNDFDWQQELAAVRAVCEGGPKGLTSIYADLAAGRRTEVDTISGSVVKASRRNGVPAPTHEALVEIVHAMEGKAETNKG